jgi:hypothetical protein
MQHSIEQFTLSLLAYKGALVETGAGATSALLGADLASALGMGEYENLVFDPSLDAPGAQRIDYDSRYFEAMGRLVDSMGSLAFAQVTAPPLKEIDPERELGRALSLQNGILRAGECIPASQVYFCFFIAYDVMADERSGGVTEVWVNPTTRSLPRAAPSLDTLEICDDVPVPDLGELASRAWSLALPAATSSVESRLREFLDSVKRRRERDLSRMREYYQAIHEEISRKLARASSKEAARTAEKQRLEATAQAYRSRAAELVERYRPTVRINGFAALACAIPTYRLRAQLLRRSAKRDAFFSWNPFDRGVEPPSCDSCCAVTVSALLCDDAVHYLCRNCFGPCPICGKPFCRACHRQCPRRHGG